MEEVIIQDKDIVTLEECSKNDNGEAVTNLQYKVYDLDRLSQREADRFRRGKKLRSADGVFVGEGNRYYFFEFKNTPKGHVPYKTIMEKAHDSILVWQVIQQTDCSLREIAERSSFYVVYNNNAPGPKANDAPSVEKMKDKLKCLAHNGNPYPVLWGLEVYKGAFYRDIYTLDVSEFEKYFVPDIFE